MVRSLYEALGRPARDVPCGPPGTLETRAVETVDNDVCASMWVSELGQLGPRPTPGTRETLTIETVDNDMVHAFDSALAWLGPPRPGTRITASYETTDEDATLTFAAFG